MDDDQVAAPMVPNASFDDRTSHAVNLVLIRNSPGQQDVIDEKEAVKRAEMLLALREKHGLDVVDLAFWMAPQVPDAIMSGRHEIVISKVHPSQVKRLIACLSDLNFTAEELPADPAEAANNRQGGLTRVVVRW